MEYRVLLASYNHIHGLLRNKYKMAHEEQFDLERKMNTLIGVDRKLIPNILKSLRSEKKFLEGRVNSASK